MLADHHMSSLVDQLSSSLTRRVKSNEETPQETDKDSDLFAASLESISTSTGNYLLYDGNLLFLS